VLKNDLITFGGLSKERLEEILFRIKNINVALIGDICLDMYWKADMTKSELSRETPHFPLPVVEERVSPGAGGNAAANIMALEPQKTFLLGVIGTDWRGHILREELTKLGIDIQGIIISKSRVTAAYCKPLRRGISNIEYEDPRIDFDNYEALSMEEEKKLLELLEFVSQKVDVLCVSDQMKFGCITDKVREKVIELARQGMTVVVDSRERIALYTDVILKPNEVEGYRAVIKEKEPKNANFEEQITAAKILANKNKAKVCMTLGSKGCVLCEEVEEPVYIPSFHVPSPIDTCGAGDCFLSAFSCALAAGASGPEAGAFANMAADIIIKKIGTTGTATPSEIRERHNNILCHIKDNVR
jgi:D-glycero-beta-D-manno-heptose-7-phosphate kinase